MIRNAIIAGTKFLEVSQNENGSFVNCTSKKKNFSQSTIHHSPFYTALILSSLNNARSSQVLLKVKKQCASYLLSQLGEKSTINYWERNSEDSQLNPYPDDLDATSCALASLYQFDNNLIDGKTMANIVSVLSLLETRVGGPYRTWAVTENAPQVWLDVDVAVNANIAFFLRLMDVNLPNLNKLIAQAIQDSNYSSPYYIGDMPTLYFISRFYNGRFKKELSGKIFSEISDPKNKKNALVLSLGVSSLLRLNGFSEKLKPIVNQILELQTKGIWKATPFVMESKKGDSVDYAGSPFLTTAFCIEALSLCEMAIQQKTENMNTDLNTSLEVLSFVAKRFRTLPDYVSVKAFEMIDLIAKMDQKNAVTQMPYVFQKALGKKGKKVSSKLMVQLACANVYGWIAYTIYDDFLDDEGKVEYLPVANIALRELTRIYEKLSIKNHEFEKIFHQIMDLVDCANAWEVTFCRERDQRADFHDMSPLSNKSIGIALGPLAILALLGFKNDSKQVNATKKFFHHYLVAKQLNDDAHDWEDDLNSKRVTPVTNLMLNKMKQKPTVSPHEIYWYEVIVEVCEIINSHIEKARECFKEMNLEKPEVLDSFLQPIEYSTREAIRQRSNSLEFIAAF